MESMGYRLVPGEMNLINVDRLTIDQDNNTSIAW